MKPGNAGMEKLIPAMNKVLDVCTQMGIHMQFDFSTNCGDWLTECRKIIHFRKYCWKVSGFTFVFQ